MKKKVILKRKIAITKYNECCKSLIQDDISGFLREGMLKEGKNYKIKITVEEK